MTSSPQGIRPHKKIGAPGMVLPTVLALSLIGSVMLLACWRNLTLAQAWSRHHQERWQAKQIALKALLSTAQAALRPPLTTDTLDSPASYSRLSDEALIGFYAHLPNQGCVQGVCAPMLSDNNFRSDWLGKTAGAFKSSSPGGYELFHWVEALPHNLSSVATPSPLTFRLTVVALDRTRHTQTGWQAVWQPKANASGDTPVRLGDLQRVLELLP